MISVSGMFAVTFSIAFAYVADCTEESDRSTAYGLVSLSSLKNLDTRCCVTNSLLLSFIALFL